MYARDKWTAVTATLATIVLGALATIELPALCRPRPDDPRDDGTWTAWHKWALGIDPRHWRRWVLVPAWTLGMGWYVLHILTRMGPKVRP